MCWAVKACNVRIIKPAYAAGENFPEKYTPVTALQEWLENKCMSESDCCDAGIATITFN